jgi:hypothetical protein
MGREGEREPREGVLDQEVDTEIQLGGPIANELVELVVAKDLTVEGGGERITL